MNIKEAIGATTHQKPYITRRAWKKILTSEPCGSAVKLQATDSPDGCIIESASGTSRPGWQPRAEDLQANDWETTGF